MMKISTAAFLLLLGFVSCVNNSKEQIQESNPASAIQGTWKLLSGTLISGGDTTVTHYTGDVSFIKIINDSYFAFLQHDLKKGKDSAAVFSAGGGKYFLKDSLYTEHLEYCSARDWEDHDFTFVVTIKEDTLIQKGVEKLEDQGINRINIEKYVRLKPSKNIISD